ncbi:MAG: hypothetical protein ACRENI_12130 [Gemmatimonadaceae bacterium]
MQSIRPRSVTELIDGSVRLTREHYGPLLVLSVIAFLPSLIVAGFMQPDPQAPLSEAFGNQQLIFTVIGYLVFAVIDGAMVHAVSQAYLGKPMSGAAESMRAAFARVWTLLGSTLLRWLIIVAPIMFVGVLAAVLVPLAGTATAMGVAGLGFLIALPFVLHFFARLAVATPAIMIEGRGAIASLSRSSTLTRGSRWRVLGAFMLIFLVFFLVAFALMLLSQLITENQIIGQIIWQFVAAFLYPLIVAATVLIYYDLRIRTEGYDLELMAEGVGAAGRAETPKSFPFS